MIFMKKQYVLTILVSFSLVLGACSEQNELLKNAKQSDVLSFASTEVKTESLALNDVTTGSVVSDQRVDVASRATGYIRQILVREGDMVEKGQVLIRLDNSDLDGAIRQVKASVNKARSALKDAQTDLERFEALFKRGSVSDNKLRKVRLQRDVARDSLKEAQAILQTTRSQQQYTQIKSPITGVIVVRHKREGDLAAPAIPLLTLESNNALLFETYVSEGRIKNIKQGDRVDVFIDALDTNLEGTVARIVPSGDPVTRKSRVKVLLPDVERLLPGMFGRTTFKVGLRQSVVVDRQSLVTRAGLDGVFVIDEKQHVHFRWLRLGKTIAHNVEILVGLNGGESIVLKPDERLNDGDLIQQQSTANE